MNPLGREAMLLYSSNQDKKRKRFYVREVAHRDNKGVYKCGSQGIFLFWTKTGFAEDLPMCLPYRQDVITDSVRGQVYHDLTMEDLTTIQWSYNWMPEMVFAPKDPHALFKGPVFGRPKGTRQMFPVEKYGAKYGLPTNVIGTWDCLEKVLFHMSSKIMGPQLVPLNTPVEQIVLPSYAGYNWVYNLKGTVRRKAEYAQVGFVRRMACLGMASALHPTEAGFTARLDKRIYMEEWMSQLRESGVLDFETHQRVGVLVDHSTCTYGHHLQKFEAKGIPVFHLIGKVKQRTGKLEPIHQSFDKHPKNPTLQEAQKFVKDVYKPRGDARQAAADTTSVGHTLSGVLGPTSKRSPITET
ncbi:hypothetical protein B0H34DRAFT_804430 [Crassisporium funariophilum]|nr:hypothetical protein B0H34DRAFT_804430 [Crassisporium funariophilum]